ncbi:LrgB family protein [Roseomonas sp. 18066]|uniref:LrgB family protein n=1 Tax=Roseomonas sp. 18066 TaxID=2681412 RepID=UPI001357413D|nr:LrgB family protein [Roseomonas sp. 18066]
MPDTAAALGWAELATSAAVWSAVTLGLYFGFRRLHQRFRAWWSNPLLATWLGCMAIVLGSGSDYRHYLSGTGWLAMLLGPATVAFALPVYEQRHVIRRHWKVLLIGVVTGSLLSVGVSWGLAVLLHLSPELRASLLPRSITTPLAMSIAGKTGGIPGLTATFTAITGLFGAACGGLMGRLLRLQSGFARGALYGMGAHGAGVARAYQVGREEGSIASTVMVVAGVLNVAVASLLVALL